MSKPIPEDRMMAHVIVGAVGAWVGHQIASKISWLNNAFGAFIGAIALAWLHIKYDAPLARLFA